MPPCRVTEADLSGVDLLEQLQRLAASLTRMCAAEAERLISTLSKA